VVYIFDTNVFVALGHFYPQRFPTIWERMDQLVHDEDLLSVREVRNEIELVCASEHINEWVKRNKGIFLIPGAEECRIVSKIFEKEQYRGLVRRKSILRGSPVADPFIIAAAKVRNGGCVVTQELLKPDAARIPSVCRNLNVKCIDLEGFFEEQDLRY
jgi:hypothetical protein